MDWTDLQITVPAKDIDTAAAIAQMVVPYGIYIEDYSDLTEEAPRIAHIDLIDEELLAKDRSNAIIHIYISPEQSPAEAIAYLTARLDQEPIPYTVDTSAVKEEEWSTAWKDYYHPTPIGRRLVVCPTWEEYAPREGEVVMRLDPGMAFGTGTHHTTRLCAGMLEETVTPGCRLLDMGLIPKTKITVTKVAPMGDPIELRLRGYTLTIRVEDARNITVAEVIQA